MWEATHPEMDRHPFRAQSCAVRDLNPERADYSHSDLSLMTMSQFRLVTTELLSSATYR
jgi:hypothetical protein